MNRGFKIILLSLLYLVPTTLAWNQPAWAWDRADPSVPIENPIYDDLDLLVSHGLITDMFIGQRPLARSEIRRLIEEASQNFAAKQTNNNNTDDSSKSSQSKNSIFLFQLLHQLKQDYAEDTPPHSWLTLHPLEEAAFNTTILKGSPRPYFGDGVIATYNPLVENSGGRHYDDGFQSAFETYHSANITPYFSLYAHPRIQLQWLNTQGPQEYGIFAQELYGTISFFNTQIDIGRKPMNWGQSRFGGTLFSNNARPFDGIQLTNPQPWKIKHFGLLKYSFFFGTLGPEQNFPYDQITGGKISWMPHHLVELAIARALIISGDGSAPASPWKIFREFFGNRQSSEFGGGGANLSNSISGLEERVTLPFLRNTIIYNEIYFDDVDFQHLWASLTQDTGILFGVLCPRLDDAGSLSARIEVHKNSSILYRHSTWTDGWTLNNFVMGDPLGADAQSVWFSISKSFIDQKTSVQNDFFFERIDSNIYLANSQGRSVLVDGTAEYRIRDMVSLKRRLLPFLTGQFGAGFENIGNYGFIQDSSANSFLIQAVFRYDGGRIWTFNK